MFDKFKLSTQQILIYSLGNIATKVAGFVLLPLFATHIPINDYSAVVLLEPVWQLLSAVLALSLPTALLRWLAPEHDIQRQKSLVFTVLAALLLLLIVFNLLAWPINHFLANRGFYSDINYKSYLNISFLLVSFDILNLLVLSLLRFREKPVQYVVLNIIKLTANILLNVLFLVKFNLGVASVFLSQLVASILLNILSLPFLLRNLKLVFLPGPLREMLAYGFPLIFTTVSSIVLSLGDRYIIEHFMSSTDTAIYGIGYKFGGILNMFIIQSFQLGFLPFAYKMLNDPGAPRFFARMFTYFILALVFPGLLLAMFSREIVVLFTLNQPGYSAAYAVIPMVTLGFIFKGSQYYFSLGLHYVKRTSYNAWIVMLCAAFSLIMNFLLVPRLGIYGSALVLVLSNLLMSLLFYYFAQRLYPIRFEWKRVGLLAALGIGFYAVASIFSGMSLYMGLFAKVILALLFPLGLYWFGFFDKDEKNRLRQGLHGILSFIGIGK
ncbi:MAG: lipopolysaccharide biosynthesis protein [Bacteroidales bacterium]